MKYFKNQTYPNKEMIVLYLNDPVTSAFAKENKNVRNLKITEIIDKNQLIVEPLSLEMNEVALKTFSGEYLSAVSFDKAETKSEIGEKETFKVEKVNGDFLLKTYEGRWVTFENGRVSFKEDLSKFSRFNFITLINNKLKLINNFNAAIPEKSENLNWRVEVANDISSDIVFCEVSSSSVLSLGTQRNMAIHLSSGKYICVWDDDDCYSKDRLSKQMGFLSFVGKSACTLANEVLLDAKSGKAYITYPRTHGWENSLLCEKSEIGHYEDLSKKEDTPVLERLWLQEKLCVMEDPYVYTYIVHNSNVSGNSHFNDIIRYAEDLTAAESDSICAHVLEPF